MKLKTINMRIVYLEEKFKYAGRQIIIDYLTFKV